MSDLRFQIGDYWLSKRPNSAQWCMTWFENRQTRRRSLRTADIEEAKIRLAREAGLEPKEPIVRYVTPPPQGKVYLVLAESVGMVKIGHSVKPKMRLSTLRAHSPVKLKLLATIPGSVSEERELHKRFQHRRSHGEWFEDCPEIRAEFGVWSSSLAKT